MTIAAPSARPDDAQREPPWDVTIRARRSSLAIPFREVWAYRGLILTLVRRDFVVRYKQTLLGPLWFLLQPLLTTMVFTVVFGGIANLSTDGRPAMLFYLAGQVVWMYYSSVALETSRVFLDHSHLIGKVYFPRLVLPCAVVGSQLLRLALQFGLFLAFVGVYVARGASVSPGAVAVLFPLLLLVLTAHAVALGLIFAALTTRFRDLRYLLEFGVQLLMFLTPIIYPASALHGTAATLIQANPLTAVVEAFRFGFLGAGQYSLGGLAYTTVLAAVLLFLGLVLFNRAERTVMDTI